MNKLTIIIVQRFKKPLQLALKMLLHLQGTGEDLDGELAIVVEELVVGLRFLEPLRLPELILVGSRRRRADGWWEEKSEGVWDEN